MCFFFVYINIITTNNIINDDVAITLISAGKFIVLYLINLQCIQFYRLEAHVLEKILKQSNGDIHNFSS